MLWLTTSDVSERHGKQTNHTGKAWDLQVARKGAEVVEMTTNPSLAIFA